MNVNEDLVGKTITGVIASHSQGGDLREIWVMQFADGSHVEFVSPGARKALRRTANQSTEQSTGQSRGQSRGQGRGQNLAHASERGSQSPSVHPVNTPGKLTNSRSMHYHRELETGAQLSLNVA